MFNYRNTYVLARIFKIDKDSMLKNEIAEYTNSQNQISAYDLKSVDSIQIQIENYLKESNILYVRKSGRTGNESGTYKLRISKEELAQILHSIQGYPDRVTNVKIRLFTEHYDDIFTNNNTLFCSLNDYIEQYFEIKTLYKQSQYRNIGTTGVFYTLYIVNNYDKSIQDSIMFLDNFIKECKPKNNRTPRWLIQKSTRELLICKLKQTPQSLL